MGISDRIETFITELLKTEAPDVWVELGRNELANIFNCVPSQINYVISTRFNPEHGYIVESRRGGGGYLKIKRLDTGGENPILTAIRLTGNSVDYPSAKSRLCALYDIGAIDEKTETLILRAVSDTTLNLPKEERDMVRANILKNTLAALIK